MRTLIRVERRDKQMFIDGKSDCSFVRELLQRLRLIEVDDVLKPMMENVIYIEASRIIRHPSCPVPCALIKAIEVELGIAVKRDVHFNFI